MLLVINRNELVLKDTFSSSIMEIKSSHENLRLILLKV